MGAGGWGGGGKRRITGPNNVLLSLWNFNANQSPVSSQPDPPTSRGTCMFLFKPYKNRTGQTFICAMLLSAVHTVKEKQRERKTKREGWRDRGVERGKDGGNGGWVEEEKGSEMDRGNKGKQRDKTRERDKNVRRGNLEEGYDKEQLLKFWVS